MNTEKLLSVTNLKKYFPIKKSSLFQKEQLYVKANENITLDIRAGETFGLVGESGCGKSTLGRVILQLYEQTAGTTMYYGRNLAELAPWYVVDTLTKIDKYVENYKKAQALADELAQKVKDANGSASFPLLQDRNLAKSDAKTKYSYFVKILGGFSFSSDRDEACKIMLDRHKVSIERFKLKEKRNTTKLDLDLLIADSQDNNKIESEKAKLVVFQKQINDCANKIQEFNNRLAELKKKHNGNKEFNKLEELLDDGVDLARLKYSEIKKIRNDIQIIFQDPYSSLNPRMTIGQIIEEGLVTHNYYKRGSKQMKEYILQTMRKCGLQDYMMHRYPHQFSGGQRQRVAIARALAVKPKFVVCDECVSALDVSIQSQIINLLQELKEKEKLTYLFISHDLSVIRYISDRIGVMYLGNLVEMGSAEQIFSDPRHPYTVALLSSIPTTDADNVNKERIILEGNIPSPIRPPKGCKFHTRCFMATEECKRVPPQLEEVEPGHFVACHYKDKKLDNNGNFTFKSSLITKEN